MNIVSFRCSEEILERVCNLNSDEGKLVLIMDKWDIEHVNYTPKILDKVTKIYEVESIDSIEELSAVYVNLIDDYGSFDIALSGTEYSMFGAGFLMSLIKNDINHLNTTIATRDKRYMKMMFSSANTKCAKYKASYSLEEMQNNINHNLKYPVVAKPVTGLGCYNTNKINNDEELKKYFEELNLLFAFKSQLITLEEFIEGDEYHLDCIIENGKCKIFAISKYFIPRLSTQNDIYNSRYMNGSYVIYESDQPELYKEIRSQFDRIINKLKIENGITHTEFFINKDGEIYFSEIAKRYGGGYIMEALNKAYGINMIDEWIKAELNFNEPALVNKNNKFIGWISLTPDTEGIIESLPSEYDYLNLPWITDVSISINEGDDFSFTNNSAWSILAVIEADNEADFHEKVRNTYEILPIKMRNLTSEESI